MDIKNEQLIELFEIGEKTNDWNSFFKKVYEIVDFVINKMFSNIGYYYYDTESLKQECVVKIWNLIIRKQIKKDSNIFSYIIGASSFLLRDVIRKENRRKKKVVIVSQEDYIVKKI